MAEVIRPPQSETRDVSIVERSWRVELLTEIPFDADIDMVDFPITVHREHAIKSDPAPPGGGVFYKGPERGKGRGRAIAAAAGPKKPGTDGTDPADYEDPIRPFFPKIRFTMNDVITAEDDSGNPATIDIEDKDGNVLQADFPLAYLPHAIIAGIEFMVKRHKDQAVEQAIAQAAQEAQEELDDNPGNPGGGNPNP